MNKSRAFTLIEILVVISVISILVGIVIPRFKGMQDEANKAKAKSELKTLQTAVESYFMNQDPDEFPATTTTICASYLNSANPVIVATPLYDPFGSVDEEYIFELAPSGSYYVLFSIGPNGDQDITSIDDNGYLTGENVDDIYATNGLGWTP